MTFNGIRATPLMACALLQSAEWHRMSISKKPSNSLGLSLNFQLRKLMAILFATRLYKRWNFKTCEARETAVY